MLWGCTFQTVNVVRGLLYTISREVYFEHIYHRATNIEQDQAGIKTEIQKREWTWIGHTFRKDNNSHKTNPEVELSRKKRKIGHPKKNSWRRIEELKKFSTIWNETKKTANKTVNGGASVQPLYSNQSGED